jgi:hypothetical protein
MAHVMGFNCKLYRNTATFGSPSWDEVTIIREVKVMNKRDKSEATTRGDAVRTYGVGRSDLSITFKLKDDNTHADYVAIRDAFLDASDLDLWAMDGTLGAAGTAEGPRGDWKVVGFDRNEDDEGVVFFDIECVPSADSSNAFEPWKEN